MPRVKSPISLFKLCAEFIARNLDDWCNPSDTELNMCNQEATCSPFDKLPSVLLEEVIHSVRHLLKASSSPDKMILKKQSLELLITPHSKSLDLSMGELNDVPYILNFASLRCPDLQTVRLVCSCNCVDIFVHLCAMKFERLQVLDISRTDAGDNCLQILGMYCKDLRELNVSGCVKITDAGIEGLCVSVNHLGKVDQRMGQCKSIETLKFISGTRITKKGIQVALINLPFLKKFEIPGGPSFAVPVQFLAEMHQSDWNIKQLKDIRKYSLESLNLAWLPYDSKFISFPYTSGSLGLVASLCPSVTVVKVEFITGLTDSDLLGLLSLENVKELEIHGNDVNTTVTFEGGVVPLLKGFGSSLKKLVLSNLKAVNIRAIIDFCPKLQSLWLALNESYSTTVSAKEDAEPYHSKRRRMEQKPLVLRNLEKLRVIHYCGDEENEISSEDLLSLLSSPSLIYIDFFASDHLTDYIFERASEIHQFLSLEKLTVCRCPSLTRRGIDVVMNNKTPLKAIEIYSCGNITEDDIDLLISNARSEKWELSVAYYDDDDDDDDDDDYDDDWR